MNNIIKIAHRLKFLDKYIHLDGILSLFALILNIKAISRLENINKIEILIKEVKNMGLFYFKYNEKTLYISKTEKRLKKGLYYDLKIKDDYNFGQLLGFPNCCINRFIEFGGVSDNQLFEYLKNSVRNKDISNSYLNIFENKLVYHIPCSMNCLESIDIGKKMFNLYLLLIKNKRYNKNYLLSKKTYILFDNLEWVKIYDGNYYYGSIYNNIGNKYIKFIRKGYTIKIKGNGIKLYYKNKDIIYTNNCIIFIFNK